ncbi:MAG: hypothetical protein ABI388_01365 [Bacteroidia bacterium]
MKEVYILFISLFILGCAPPNNSVIESRYKFSGQDDYELVTRIEFPKDFKVISNPPAQTATLVRTAIIELNKNDCIKFYKMYKFEPIEDTISPQLFGSNYMDSIYKLIPDRGKYLNKYGKNYGSPLYFKYNKEKDTNWLYLLDTTTCRLYCLISYADLKGYAK